MTGRWLSSSCAVPPPRRCLSLAAARAPAAAVGPAAERDCGRRRQQRQCHASHPQVGQAYAVMWPGCLAVQHAAQDQHAVSGCFCIKAMGLVLCHASRTVCLGAMSGCGCRALNTRIVCPCLPCSAGMVAYLGSKLGRVAKLLAGGCSFGRGGWVCKQLRVARLHLSALAAAPVAAALRR